MMLFLAASPAFAQDLSPVPSVEEVIGKMKEKLELTQDQVSAVTPIIEKYTSKFQDLKQSMGENKDLENLSAQMKKLLKDEGQELSQFLSLEQMRLWKSMQHARRRKHGIDGEQEPREGNGGVINAVGDLPFKPGD
jgi:hypothetical protein